MKEQCFFVWYVKYGKGITALSRERKDALRGEEEDGEWRGMGHRYPGKNPRKVGRALLPMKLVSSAAKSQCFDAIGWVAGRISGL